MSEKWIAALFSKLQVRYGHKWASALPTPELVRLSVTEWADQLSGLTGEQVRHGLETWREDWPPSAPEFRKACTGDTGLHKSAAYRTYKALSSKPASHETALMYLRDIKLSMRTKTPQERYMAYLIAAECASGITPR